ncbi:hypothetical protein HYX07_03890 [Candidatus Woesearchaeota archaeon]|nr:hypothetical protein [Candidatus Woesearchaeota archaeon]
MKPEIAMERISHRQKEKFEQLEFMKRIRAYFLKMPRLLKDNIKVMDSNKSLNEVFASIRKEVDIILEKN